MLTVVVVDGEAEVNQCLCSAIGAGKDDIAGDLQNIATREHVLQAPGLGVERGRWTALLGEAALAEHHRHPLGAKPVEIAESGRVQRVAQAQVHKRVHEVCRGPGARHGFGNGNATRTSPPPPLVLATSVAGTTDMGR